MNLEKTLRPGDVINIDGTANNPITKIVHISVRHFQKKLFGKHSIWWDTHTMLYLDDTHILSIELPTSCWRDLSYLSDKKYTVWRFRKRDITKNDINVMFKAANKLIGKIYDIGQLLDIAINHILGYTVRRKYKIFDFGKRCKICSVGVRSIYEFLLQYIQKNENKNLQKLFTCGNKSVDVEITTPAHFANSVRYENEFVLVAKNNNFSKGE